MSNRTSRTSLRPSVYASSACLMIIIPDYGTGVFYIAKVTTIGAQNLAKEIRVIKSVLVNIRKSGKNINVRTQQTLRQI